MKTIADFIGGSPFGDDTMPPFKEGQPSEHALGVLYQGPWESMADGFNEHVRRCARALALTGCPVHLRGFLPPDTSRARYCSPEIDAIAQTSINRYSVQVNQVIVTPAVAQRMVVHRYLSAKEMQDINRYRVVSTVLERDRVSPDIVRSLQQMAQVWVACHANRDTLVRCGLAPERVKVVPIPYFPDDPLLALRGRVRKPGVPRFYHIGKWEPRKAQDQIILAFMQAFKPGEAHLVLKTTLWSPPKNDSYPMNPEIAIAKAIHAGVRGWTDKNWKSSIEIISDRLTDRQLLALHRFGDVYVTLSRGEGFDMPAFDAKLAGNVLVYTPSGGPQDFAGAGDYLVSATEMVPCHPFYSWEPDAQYLDFDVTQAAEALRRAGQWPDLNHDPVQVSVVYTAEIAGENMLRNLYEVVGKDRAVYG